MGPWAMDDGHAEPGQAKRTLFIFGQSAYHIARQLPIYSPAPSVDERIRPINPPCPAQCHADHVQATAPLLTTPMRVVIQNAQSYSTTGQE